MSLRTKKYLLLLAAILIPLTALALVAWQLQQETLVSTTATTAAACPPETPKSCPVKKCRVWCGCDAQRVCVAENETCPADECGPDNPCPTVAQCRCTWENDSTVSCDSTCQGQRYVCNPSGCNPSDGRTRCDCPQPTSPPPPPTSPPATATPRPTHPRPTSSLPPQPSATPTSCPTPEAVLDLKIICPICNT